MTGCASPNTVAVTPPTETTDTSASVSTTVRVAESAGFAIDYRVTSQWGNGFTAEVTIHNTSPDPIPAWTLNWTFPQDPTQITNLWNGTVSQTSTQVTVSNLSHNSVIPAGGSVNFGFQASYPGGDLTTPVAFIFNGQLLAQPTPTPASLACLVDYSVSSSWNEGFVANLTIRNLGGSVTGWELGFDFPVDGVSITNLWNGSLNQTGRTVQVTNLDWNKTIPANGTASVGFQAAHSGGSVTPTGFRLNGVPCTGQPATPIPSAPPIPANSIVILNAEVVDGTPYTIGQTIELNAAARNANNQDISNQIQWFNAEGENLGTGSRLIYSAQSTKAETITARISLGSEIKTAQVSFNVSPPGVILARGVKVLPDATTVLDWSLENGTGYLEIERSPALPTIAVGNVLVGANYQLPPVRVLTIDDDGSSLWLEILEAMPGEVIELGETSFDQDVEFTAASPGERRLSASDSRSNGCQFSSGIGCQFSLELYRQPFISTDLNLSPTFPQFQDSGQRTGVGGSIIANASFQITPHFTGGIEFNTQDNPLTGIKRFVVDQSTTINARATLGLDGILFWGASPRLQMWQSLPIRVIMPPIGPVPAWIDIATEGYLETQAGITVALTGSEIGFEYSGASLRNQLLFDARRDPAWEFKQLGDGGHLSPIVTRGQLDVTGNLEVALLPNIVFKLWSTAGLYIGSRMYMGGELGLANPTVTVIVPSQGQSFLSSQPIPLNAAVNGGIKLSLYTGVNLTAGVAGLEVGPDPESCSNTPQIGSTPNPPADDAPPYNPFPLPNSNGEWNCADLINWAESRNWEQTVNNPRNLKYDSPCGNYILAIRKIGSPGSGSNKPRWGILRRNPYSWIQPNLLISQSQSLTGNDFQHLPLAENSCPV
ncbi:MAG: hypothetical protein OHK0012_26660 [Synechococcales cyanobacterium]